MTRCVGVSAAEAGVPDWHGKGIENHMALYYCGARFAIFHFLFSDFHLLSYRTRRARRKDVNANTSIMTA
jgi:hypothetical protein